MGSGRATLTAFIHLVAAFMSFRRHRWWTKTPFLPVPDRKYFQWRMYTAYGAQTARPTWSDLVGFAEWRWGVEQYRQGVAE